MCAAIYLYLNFSDHTQIIFHPPVDATWPQRKRATKNTWKGETWRMWTLGYSIQVQVEEDGSGSIEQSWRRRRVVYGSTGWPKNWHTFLYALTSYALTLSNIDRFLNVFHCLNQENISNNTVPKHPTTPQVCRYATLWNDSVLKARIKKQYDFCNNRFFEN